MKVGVDTWFLFLLSQQDLAAMRLLDAVHRGKYRLYLSTLSLAEFAAYAYRQGQPIEARKIFADVKRLKNTVIVPVTAEISQTAARKKIGLGLSLIDAIILSTALTKGCEAFIALDLILG